MTVNEVKSPLISSSKIRLLETYATAALVEDWKKTFDMDISKEFGDIERIFLYRCEESNLDFFVPAIAGSSQLYKDLQKFDWFYMPHKWEFDEALRDLSDCKRILEVGCGQGFFIEKALKRLKGSTVKGIEFSEEAIQKASQKHLPVEKADLQKIIERGETFDAICCFQVLEHVSNPREFLNSMLTVLEPNGRLILCVPNRDSFLKYQYNLLDMPPHHLTRWNLDTFKYIEKLFPLKLVKSAFEPLAKYHISAYMLAHAWKLHKRFPKTGIIFSNPVVPHVFSAIIRITGLYRFLRGQSLYVMFRKI